MKDTLAHRFDILDAQRHNHLYRARRCAELTIPTLLPRESTGENSETYKPFSSVPARGVTGLASKMLSAMLPLNDMPFFQLGLVSGVMPSPPEKEYLELVSYQVHKKLTSKNLRDTLFQALQHLIVVGDVMIKLEDDWKLRLIRLDHYVVVRNAVGDVKEFIYLDFKLKDDAVSIADPNSQLTHRSNSNYDVFYNQFKLDDKKKIWHYKRENAKGEVIESNKNYTTDSLPYAISRWSNVPGEHYGRSFVEDNQGDIESLEVYTQALMESFVAASSWWPALDPTGVTELDDVNGRPIGAWIAAREQEVFILSPANTMQAQIKSAFDAVENTRRQVSIAFLDAQGQVRQAERVTAAEIRMIGQELEQVLGGAFSATASSIYVPLVKRAFSLMIRDKLLDPRFTEDVLSSDDGVFAIDIITGLQALSRENDLVKLMQLGDMMRNLPEEAMQSFRWETYARALVTSLGMNPAEWVVSEEEKQQQQQAQQAQEMGMQAAGQGMGAGIQEAAALAASQLVQGA